MKIAMDSNDLPYADRSKAWRALLCDTYMGLDCAFPESFRSVIEGYALREYTLTRITSTQHVVDRSPTLIKRDGLELIFFGLPLAGRAAIIQGGREGEMQPGTIVISDSSRPLTTRIYEAADILWLSVPKKPMADRLRDIEDLVAKPLRPGRSIEPIATGLMAGFDEMLAQNLPAHVAEGLVVQLLDILALTILSADLPPKRPPSRTLRVPIQ